MNKKTITGKLPSGIKEVLLAGKRNLQDLTSSVFEKYFVASIKECTYFPKGMDSFAVILKGKSLERIPKYEKEFNDCFLVNNFDKEVKIIGNSLEGKNCVQFVNRLHTACMSSKDYKKFNIADIQLSKVSTFGDKRMNEVVKHYKSLGLRTHFLPKKLLKFNKEFSREYAKKYPNTGILAIIYALEMLKPKTLWIIGLDFYQSDYLVRRPHQNPIEVQRRKMKRLNLVKVTADVFKKFPSVKINMVTYYKGFLNLPNLTILRGSK